MISGRTEIVAHLGWPTESFKAPLIWNPWFEAHGIDAVVVPMGVRAEDYAAFLPQLFRLTNVRAALVTMPHKVTTVAMLDAASTAVRIAGSCNAILRRPDGTLAGEMFDGEGFVRGLARKGFRVAGTRAFVCGTGGVGAAIAASLAAAGVARLSLFDPRTDAAAALAARLRTHYPAIDATVTPNDPAGHDLVVNASPLGMRADDPLPMDVARIRADAFVGEVVMKDEITPFLAAARARGCRFQVGTDMLFEQIPAYLEYFGYGTATPEELRARARLA